MASGSSASGKGEGARSQESALRVDEFTDTKAVAPASELPAL